MLQTILLGCDRRSTHVRLDKLIRLELRTIRLWSYILLLAVRGSRVRAQSLIHLDTTIWLLQVTMLPLSMILRSWTIQLLHNWRAWRGPAGHGYVRWLRLTTAMLHNAVLLRGELGWDVWREWGWPVRSNGYVLSDWALLSLWNWRREHQPWVGCRVWCRCNRSLTLLLWK